MGGTGQHLQKVDGKPVQVGTEWIQSHNRFGFTPRTVDHLYDLYDLFLLHDIDLSGQIDS